MKFYIGVENFGKINKAEIEVSNFAVFVGNNNSGKTFLMQLIYGVLAEIRNFRYKDAYKELELNKKTLLDANWFQKLEVELNEFLCQEKEEIIAKTFNKQIPIDKLYIRLESFEDRIEVDIFEKEKI